MRCIATWILVAIAGVLVSGTANAEAPKTIDLLAGDSLAAWDFFLIEPNVKMEDVWNVQDGVLTCKGKPLGYLYTKEKFKNFHLTLQWRWPPGTKPSNSGVLLRIVGDAVSFLPRCVEAQLQHGNAGDLWGFYGAKLKGPADRMREIKAHKKLGDFVGIGHIKDAEKPAGQWNLYDITMDGGKLTVNINGQKVNEATGCDVRAGNIGLQSEGGEIEFRKIELTPLP